MVILADMPFDAIIAVAVIGVGCLMVVVGLVFWIERWVKGPSFSRHGCEYCGYDLRGLPTANEAAEVPCPECGRGQRVAPRRQP